MSFSENGGVTEAGSRLIGKRLQRMFAEDKTLSLAKYLMPNQKNLNGNMLGK